MIIAMHNVSGLAPSRNGETWLADLTATKSLLKQGRLGEMNVAKTGEFFRYSNFVAYCSSELGELLDRQSHYTVA